MVRDQSDSLLNSGYLLYIIYYQCLSVQNFRLDAHLCGKMFDNKVLNEEFQSEQMLESKNNNKAPYIYTTHIWNGI